MHDFFILYGLTFIGVVITFLAEVFVTSAYKKYEKISNKRGMTGKEAARYLLDKNGLSDIKQCLCRISFAFIKYYFVMSPWYSKNDL